MAALLRDILAYIAECWRTTVTLRERGRMIWGLVSALLALPIVWLLGGRLEPATAGVFWTAVYITTTALLQLAVISPFIMWRERRVSHKGAAEIFQEEERLSFKEIAHRWEASSGHATPADTVLNWLVSDTWKGKFEDEKGASKLQMLGGWHGIESGDSEVLLSSYSVEASRSMLFAFFVRDCPQLFRAKFGARSPLAEEEDWSVMLNKVDWGWLANIDPKFFDEPGTIGSLKARVLERLTIARPDFEGWLSTTKRPLPKAWSQ